MWAAMTKTLQTGCLINNRNLFLEVVEAGSPRSWYQHGCFPVRAFFLVHNQRLLSGSLHSGRGRELCGGSFIKALILFMSIHPHGLNISQRPHLQTPHHWALGFQHKNLGETQTFRPQQRVREICNLTKPQALLLSLKMEEGAQ